MYLSLQLCLGISAVLVVLFHLGGAVGSEKYFNLPALAQSLVFQGSRGAALAFVTTLLLCVLAGHAFHRWVGRPLLRTLHRPGSALPVAPAARSK